MKQLTCELCGSTDLVKQDGFFVCHSCGTKYSVEEAKKLMIEGIVDVSGSTVKVDTSSELKNLYDIARRAKNNNNYDNAARYYDMILLKDPSSWEANFYMVYYKSLQCKIAEIPSAAIDVRNCLGTVLTLIRDNISNVEDQVNTVKEISEKSISIATLLTNAATNHYNGIDLSIRTRYINSYLTNLNATHGIVLECASQIELVFPNVKELNEVASMALKKLIGMYNNDYGTIDYETFLKMAEPLKNRVKIYEPNYELPMRIKSTSGACYIATVVYESYDCPEVWTLRRFRDYKLAETWYGRTFIKIYYVISPTLVRLFGHKEWFRKMWKGKLDKMVANLKSYGIEDTPYKDRNW